MPPSPFSPDQGMLLPLAETIGINTHPVTDQERLDCSLDHSIMRAALAGMVAASLECALQKIFHGFHSETSDRLFPG